MNAPKVSFNPSHQPSPWRVYFRGKSYWFHTQADAEKKKTNLEGGSTLARLSTRELDEYLYSRELLKGISVLRAVRYFLEHNAGRMRNAAKTVRELVSDFTARLRGRPKYLQEAKRNLRLLVEHCGNTPAADVGPETMMRFLDGFKSDWSHDNALRYAKSFFKWTMSAQVRARRDNPCDEFKMKNPTGSKVYLSIDDAAHVLKICREEFPKLLPAVGFQLFAGIRTEEIIRIEWRSIRRGMIRIEPEVGKMGQVKGKQVPRMIDFWPAALDACLPVELPPKGKVVKWYDRMKTRLLARCHETKPSFRWGQNAFRHSYGTYGLAFFQSADRMCQLMGERDADTLHNHYAEYETQDHGQRFFSVGASKLEALPIPKGAMNLLQDLMREVSKRAAPQEALKTESAA